MNYLIQFKQWAFILLLLSASNVHCELAVPNHQVSLNPKTTGLFLYFENFQIYEHVGFFSSQTALERPDIETGFTLRTISRDGNYFPGWTSSSIGSTSWPPQYWGSAAGPFLEGRNHKIPTIINACRPGRNFYQFSLGYYPYTGQQLFDMWDGGLPVPATAQIPFTLPIYRMIKGPGWLENGNSDTFSYEFPTKGGLAIYTSFPSNKFIGANIEIPALKRLGISLPVNGYFEYQSESGRWQLTLGAGVHQETKRRGARPKKAFFKKAGGLYIGNRELELNIQADARGTATEQNGIHLDDLESTLGLSGRFEGGRYGLLEMFPLARILSVLPFIDTTDLSPIKVIVYFTVGLDGKVTLHFTQEDATLVDGQSQLEGCIGVELETHVNLLSAQATLMGGGELCVVMKLGNANIFDDVSGKIYAEVEVTAGSFFYKRVFEQDFAIASAPAVAGDLMQRAEENLATFAPSLIPRAGARSQSPKMNQAISAVSGDILAPNILPASSCAAAGWGTERMVLYVSDSGAQNTVQFTDISFAYYDGTQWSSSEPVSTDARAEFAPKIAFLVNGDALAVWERFADPAFNVMDWTLAAAQREIVWARWHRSTKSWTTPVALTANSHMDHDPHLVGPLADGSLLLTWIENTANHYTGSPAAPNSIKAAVFNAATLSWSSLVTVVAEIKRQGSPHLVAGADKAVLVWTEDIDGLPETPDDIDTRYAIFQNGTWNVGTVAEEVDASDAVARAIIRPDGEVFIFASGSGNSHLRMARGIDGSLKLVDPNPNLDTYIPEWNVTFPGPDIVDFNSGSKRRVRYHGPQHEFQVLCDSDGRIILVWPDVRDENKTTLLKATFDPDVAQGGGAGSWTEIDTFCATPGLIKSLAFVWKDSALIEAYGTVTEITVGPRTLELPDGTTVQVAKMPGQGQVDLVKMLGEHGPDLKVEVTEPTSLTNGSFGAMVQNVGDVEASASDVAYYLNDPAQGGQLIGTASLEPLQPGQIEYVYLDSFAILPIGTTSAIYAVVDPSNQVAETTETNNTGLFDISGTDLGIQQSYDYTRRDDGSLEFSLTVQNYHVATSGPFTIAIRREGSTQTLWSHTMSPLAMDQSITVSATLPAGTQPDSAEEMEFVAYITGGETANSEYEDNNTLIMGTIADRDRDGDGIPNLEELPFGFSPDNPADGQEDSDGDGASNGAEFIAGTDMQNQASRFVVSYFNRAMSASIPGKEDVHLRWPSALGRVYSIEKSSDLRQWTALASSVVATPPLNNHVLQVPLSQLPQFYRISVKYP